MDKQEKEKKAQEIADKLTEEIVSNCEPDEMGMVASLILKRLHNMYQTRIASSETNLQNDQNAYSSFISKIDFPLIENKVMEG